MLPAPERHAVLEQVRQLAQSLDGAIDEGTGASLDRLIESWTQRWMATVQSEYADHCARIKDRRAQAREHLTEATSIAEHERETLGDLRSDLAASRRRLSGEASDPVPAPTMAAPAAAATATPLNTPQLTVMDPLRPPQHQEWVEPHLVAGRGWIGLVIGVILIVIGAMADTIAFHNVLELVLRTESEDVAWLMAGGTTSMALVAAGTLGRSRATRRRGRFANNRYRPSSLPQIASATVWLGLGLAMFLIRWRDAGVTVTFSFNGTPTSGQNTPTIYQAVFFLAIYLISGVCTIFEAERLHNPEYAAFRRLREQYAAQARVLARAEKEKERAQAALDRCDEELQAQADLRDHAITDRKGLGAEAANYARVVMAAMMRDPAKTGITETGPVHMPPIVLGAGPTWTAAAATGPGQPSSTTGTL